MKLLTQHFLKSSRNQFNEKKEFFENKNQPKYFIQKVKGITTLCKLFKESEIPETNPYKFITTEKEEKLLSVIDKIFKEFHQQHPIFDTDVALHFDKIHLEYKSGSKSFEASVSPSQTADPVSFFELGHDTFQCPRFESTTIHEIKTLNSQPRYPKYAMLDENWLKQQDKLKFIDSYAEKIQCTYIVLFNHK